MEFQRHDLHLSAKVGELLLRHRRDFVTDKHQFSEDLVNVVGRLRAISTTMSSLTRSVTRLPGLGDFIEEPGHASCDGEH